MELRHLRYFVAVVAEGHLTRAARRIGIAQPALTQQIKALEAELGIRLFDRAGRGIVATEAARAFAEEARAILARVDGAVQHARQVARGLAGRVRVGFTESASFHPLVTGSFHRFRARYPEVRLDLEEGDSTALAAGLAEGRVDAAFVRPPLPAAGTVRLDPLAAEAMVAALPVGHALAGRESLTLTDLAAETFILYPRAVRPGLADAVLAACEAEGFHPVVGQTTPQLSSTVNFVAAGIGVSIVPACMAEMRPKGVRYLPLVGPQPSAMLGIAWRRGEPAQAVRNFVATARAGRGALAAPPP